MKYLRLTKGRSAIVDDVDAAVKFFGPHAQLNFPNHPVTKLL